jgi:hypothetical protein
MCIGTLFHTDQIVCCALRYRLFNQCEVAQAASSIWMPERRMRYDVPEMICGRKPPESSETY